MLVNVEPGQTRGEFLDRFGGRFFNIVYRQPRLPAVDFPIRGGLARHPAGLLEAAPAHHVARVTTRWLPSRNFTVHRRCSAGCRTSRRKRLHDLFPRHGAGVAIAVIGKFLRHVDGDDFPRRLLVGPAYVKLYFHS